MRKGVGVCGMGEGGVMDSQLQSSSPKRERNPTFSDLVSERVLVSCRSEEPNASISSVLRDSCGRTIVRVRSSSSSGNPFLLLKALQKAWPLANTSVIDNALDGSVEAEIIVPREQDEVMRAKGRAKSSRLAEFSWMMAVVLFVVGISLHLLDLHNSQYNDRNSTASDDRDL